MMKQGDVMGTSGDTKIPPSQGLEVPLPLTLRWGRTPALSGICPRPWRREAVLQRSGVHAAVTRHPRHPLHRMAQRLLPQAKDCSSPLCRKVSHTQAAVSCQSPWKPGLRGRCSRFQQVPGLRAREERHGGGCLELPAWALLI